MDKKKAAHRLVILRYRIPDAYAELETCSDYWSSYAEGFDPDIHQSVGKHTGLTTHVERFNATARHRLGRLTRKTSIFSRGGGIVFDRNNDGCND